MADISASTPPLSVPEPEAPIHAGPPLAAEVNPRAVKAAAAEPEAEPVVEVEPEVSAAADETVQEAETPAAASAEEETPVEAQPSETQPKEPKGVGKRLAAMQAEIDAAKAEAAKLRADLERAPPAVPEFEPPARPKRENFDDPDLYDAALVEWTAAATAGRIAHDSVKNAQTQREQQYRDAQQRAWTSKVEAITEKYPDYKTVTARDDIKVSPIMTEAIRESDNGPDIVYHLGKNPTEAARIMQLPPMKQAFEINKLSMTLAEGDKVQVTRAPPPIKPVGAKSTAVRRTAESARTMEEFAAIRDAERAAKRNQSPANGLWQKRQ